MFKRHGLAQVNPLGEKFNPNHHEALFEQVIISKTAKILKFRRKTAFLLQPLEGKDPGTVIAVTKIGYKLHERIIRPAMVGVAK